VYSAAEIPTPAIVIDLPTVHRNIAKLAAYGRTHNLSIRPHTKTHKSVEMAQLQLQAGAGGLAVAKAGEAQAMAEVCEDILIAYPAFDPYRREALCKLATHKTVRVAVDSQTAIEALAEAARSHNVTLGLLVDIDVGHHRTGVQSPQESLELAQLISQTKDVRLDGIMCYPGHLKLPIAEQADPLKSVSTILQESLDLWRRSGLQATIVSGGSTPTAYQSHFVPQYTEIRPGTYIYNDASTLAGAYCTLDECAARVVATVISIAVKNKFVLDCGSKTLTQDRRSPNPETAGHGYIVEYPNAVIVRLSEEHAEVDASKCDARPKLGDRLHIIPNHICPCINLHDRVWITDEGKSPREMPIDARGLPVLGPHCGPA
jgi:D-serine deaminase-like pyridoxal phosphate-dependent protein